MKSAQIADSQQNNYAYSNWVQQTMVNNQKAKKSKYWFNIHMIIQIIFILLFFTFLHSY